MVAVAQFNLCVCNLIRGKQSRGPCAMLRSGAQLLELEAAYLSSCWKEGKSNKKESQTVKHSCKNHWSLFMDKCHCCTMLALCGTMHMLMSAGLLVTKKSLWLFSNLGFSQMSSLCACNNTGKNYCSKIITIIIKNTTKGSYCYFFLLDVTHIARKNWVLSLTEIMKL